MESLRRADHLVDDALTEELQARATELSDDIRKMASDWLDSADIAWMTVHEDRPEDELGATRERRPRGFAVKGFWFWDVARWGRRSPSTALEPGCAR